MYKDGKKFVFAAIATFFYSCRRRVINGRGAC
ncbi:KxYKxGKxW signal peptide domain-containing protein [Levilactobacillus brevis]